MIRLGSKLIDLCEGNENQKKNLDFWAINRSIAAVA